MTKNIDRAISKELQRIAKIVDKELEKVAGERVGFSLIAFTLDNDGQTNYVSNCTRQKASIALGEVLRRWEAKGAIDIPAHHKH